MRYGDFSIEVVPHGEGRVRELESGHVLARPGQVYRLRLRNLGPLYCVVDVEIDGHAVTGGGLVLEPWDTTELERPVDGREDGRFTVVAEGDERVFGPDGGRDDPKLGLIEARFRRELPRREPRAQMPRPMPWIESPDGPSRVPTPPLPSRIPDIPPRWSPTLNRLQASAPTTEPGAVEARELHEAIERAAGTGLTGHSDQRFVPIHLGPLETDATIIRLRLVIATESALDEPEAPRPLGDRAAPARPAPRP